MVRHRSILGLMSQSSQSFCSQLREVRGRPEVTHQCAWTQSPTSQQIAVNMFECLFICEGKGLGLCDIR